MASPEATSVSGPELVAAASDKIERSKSVLPATGAPAGFKIVKVRKPDGTIVKVRRPVKPDADSLSPLQTSPKVSNTISKQAPNEKTSDVIPPMVEPNNHAGLQAGISKNVPVERAPSSLSNEIKTTEVKADPKPRSETKTTEVKASPKPLTTGDGKTAEASKTASRLATPAKTYKLYRTMHKLHRNFSRTIGAFDSNGDMGDADDDVTDMESGDDEICEESDTSSSDDDSDNDNNDNDRNQEDSPGAHEKSYSESRALPPAHSTGHTSTHSSTITPKHVKREIPMNTQETNGASEKGTKAGFQINEKEIQPSVITENQAQQSTPRNLKTRSTISQYVIWGIMITLPLLYIILGILTATQTGAPVGSSIGSNVHVAIPFAVTAWPIIFAAIAAQSLKILATYKVERGLRLMTLEQLISSHSVAGAIKQPFLLRRLDWISIALLILWSLSPLASQAMQHMATTGFSAITNTTQIFYVSTTGSNYVFNAGLGTSLLSSLTEVDGLYSAGFVAPNSVLYSPQDSWNNTKIPRLDLLQGQSSQDGWFETSTVFVPTAYSSMLGIPFNLTEPVLGLDMTFQSAYLTITECSPLVVKAQNEVNHTNPNPSNDNPFKPNYTLAISPSGTLIMSLASFGESSIVGEQDGQDVFTPPELPGVITFASLISGTAGTDYGNPVFAYSTCNITQTYVDSHITCPQDEWCFVDRMRYTPGTNPPGYLFPGFLEGFVNATSTPDAGAYSFTERYILDPDHLDQEQQAFNITQTVTLPQFKDRLALLINTFWQAGYSPTEQTSGNFSDGFATIVSTAANSTLSQDIYTTNWGWLSTLIVCSVALLVFGVAGAIWDAQTIGPDVLGFASSIIRRNKYIDLPKGDSTMTGAERARMLADVEVMMQDVKADKEVGKIALGTVSEGTQRLKRGRLYR
ncbi:hypothetical protein MMC18_006641 [Xylographa bjoerkii]|nr:hypothetical protein [Xylographa bjoerkii]